MKRELATQLIPIILLVLAVCTPIIYTSVSSISTWAIALTLAWILLLAVYVGLALIKWK
ncbi:MAG: hypothetical protein L2C94_001130 [Aigarchaeota archaeon]|nr:hypothetical protein [Candidatus Wolframiiraptor gerlachensis]